MIPPAPSASSTPRGGTRLAPVAALAAGALAMALVGCAPAEPGADAAALDAPRVRDAGTDAGPPPPVDPDPRGIVEIDDPGGVPSCEPADACLDDYRRFVWLASAHARPTDIDTVVALLEQIDADLVPQETPPLSEGALRARIVDALNVGFLLDGLDARTLEVRHLGTIEHVGHVEHQLELRDPWVGAFGAILLEPTTPGPHAALVAVHGHGDTAAIYRDDYHGAEHAPRGYVTLILSMRAMGNDLAALREVQITRTLMESGFSLMGMRVYETLLGIRYLRHLATVDPARVAMIGHSGGSSTGNLVVHVDPTLAAFVSDHQVDYAEWVPAVRAMHCETVPAIYGISAQIDDRAAAPVPTLGVPYRYTNGMQEIFDFLDAHTAPPP